MQNTDIIVDNAYFPYEVGIKLLKKKFIELPEHLFDIKKDWDLSNSITISDVLSIANLESRRVAFKYFTHEEFEKELSPELVSEVTLNKTLHWYKETPKDYKDTYKLYKILAINLFHSYESILLWDRRNTSLNDYYFVKFKDTTTDREYMIWVDYADISRNKTDNSPVDAIDAIAWTMQTIVPEGMIDHIIRQGDCILIKPTDDYKPLTTPRHLTRKEYFLINVES